MKNIKSHFEMHTRFRNGIFLLAVLIFFLLVVAFFAPFSRNSEVGIEELTEFQLQIDSLKKKRKEDNKAYALQPFNPNFITEYKGYVLGLSSEQLNSLYQYRAKERWINSVGDFQKVTGVSDSLLKTIKPLLKFPDWINSGKKVSPFKKINYPKKTYAQKGDLNAVTSDELQSSVGVPDFIAERIISYREKIGGFVHDIQLKDVRGLYDSQRNKLVSLYTVKTKPVIQRIDVNRATVKELMEVPYFDFETALSIKDYVTEHQGISELKELREIEGFSLEKLDRIALYLMVK